MNENPYASPVTVDEPAVATSRDPMLFGLRMVIGILCGAAAALEYAAESYVLAAISSLCGVVGIGCAVYELWLERSN